MAEIAAVGGPRWFQVYLLADAGARRALVERAVAQGYEALVLTVDLQRLGPARARHAGRLPRSRTASTFPNVAVAARARWTRRPTGSFVER